MPQIRIEHSSALAGTFDRRAVAVGIHELCVAKVNATLEACKARVLDIGEPVMAGGDAGPAMVHVDIGLLKGRTTEAKAALSDAVLELLEEVFGSGAPGVSGVALSVEIRDMDTDTYRKKVLA